LRLYNRISICVTIALALTGCAPPPAIDLAGQIARSTGATESIEYRTIGQPLDAQEQIAGVLTLPDALAMALRNDSQLQAAMARLRAAQADANQARLLPNPILSIAVRFPEGGGKPTIDAGLTADLLALLQRPKQISAADHRMRAAGFDVLNTALDLVDDVQQAYAAVQSIDAEIANLEQRRTLVTRMLDSARSRAAAGESSRLDVLPLETSAVQIDAEILQVQAERMDQRLLLARLIGKPSDDAQWAVTPWQPPNLANLDERPWINAALTNRPEVQWQRWELAALGDESANAGLGFLDGMAGGIDSEREDGNFSAGPSAELPIPIFDWGQARRDKAVALQVEARHKLVAVQRKVVEEIRRALASVRLTDQSLEMVRAQLIPLLERRHEQTSQAYQLGETNITAVLLAEQELQEARAKAITIERKLATAYAALVRAAGGAGAVP
jgi:outer membrane protein TolC